MPREIRDFAAAPSSEPLLHILAHGPAREGVPRGTLTRQTIISWGRRDRRGGRGENSSGDIFAAFSTANARASSDTSVARVAMLQNARINPLFSATVQATE